MYVGQKTILGCHFALLLGFPGSGHRLAGPALLPAEPSHWPYTKFAYKSLPNLVVNAHVN